MTFDEYNTDENFDNDKSSLEELVKKGKEEGKSKDEIRKALSPKWQKSSKINKFDEYYGEDLPKKKEPSADDAVGIKALKSINAAPEAPKSNPPEKPAEEKTTPKVEKMTQTTEALEQPKTEQKEEKTPYTSPLETEETGIKQSDKNYMNEVNAILNEEQKKELQKLAKTSADDYNRTMENMERSGDAFKKIDDRLIEQLPTFMFKRYQQGEFGDPKSSDAKLRLAYFAMNNVVSKLKQFANASAAARGQGTLFQNTESAYDQYQKTNLEQGLENRWNKYKAETDSAIKMVQDRNVSEEDALNIINKISMNNRLQNAFNMADANKKAYMIEVLSKVGDKVSNWNDQKFINALIGAEMTGEDVGSAATLIGARAGGKILDSFNLIDENGNIDLSALKDAINIPGFADKFKSQFGFDPNKLLEGGDGGVIDTVIDTVTDRGNTYEGEDTKKGNGKDKILGVGNVNMSDKTMKSYYALNEKKPAGIKTDLPGKDIIVQTINDFPDKGVVGVIEKSGVSKSINKQFSEIDDLASQATKDFKNDGDLKKYQNRMKELYDYRNELQSVYKNFGKAPIPGNSIQSDYDKAFSNKESKFRDKYSK